MWVQAGTKGWGTAPWCRVVDTLSCGLSRLRGPGSGVLTGWPPVSRAAQSRPRRGFAGDTAAGPGLSSGSAGAMDSSRGEEEPRAPAGPGPAHARPRGEAARTGSGAAGCPAAAEPCAGVGPGRGDWQGGEEAQEISQWLYGQHRVSCSSPRAATAPGPDCTGRGPRRTPVPARRQGPRGTRRLEGLCPGGALAGTGTPLWGWGCLGPGPLGGSWAVQRHVPAPCCCTLATGQGTQGLQLGPVWLPVAVLESQVLRHVQARHLPLGLGAPSPSCQLPAHVPAPAAPRPGVPGCPCRGCRGDWAGWGQSHWALWGQGGHSCAAPGAAHRAWRS